MEEVDPKMVAEESQLRDNRDSRRRWARPTVDNRTPCKRNSFVASCI